MSQRINMSHFLLGNRGDCQNRWEMRMNKIRLLVVILLLMCFRTAYAASSSLIPLELKYEGSHYYYDPRWKDEERIVKADMDHDGQNEIVISMYMVRWIIVCGNTQIIMGIIPQGSIQDKETFLS